MLHYLDILFHKQLIKSCLWERISKIWSMTRVFDIFIFIHFIIIYFKIIKNVYSSNLYLCLYLYLFSIINICLTKFVKYTWHLKLPSRIKCYHDKKNVIIFSNSFISYENFLCQKKNWKIFKYSFFNFAPHILPQSHVLC